MKLQRVGGQWAYFYNQNKVMPNEHWPFSFYPIFKRMEQKLYYPGQYWGKVNYFLSDWCIQWHFWRFYTDPFDGLQEGCDLERVDVVLCITVCGGQWQWTESRYLDNGGPTSALCTQTLTRVQPGVTISQYSRCRVVAILSCLRIQAFSTIFCWYFDCF